MEVKKLPSIDVLINNVGITYQYVEYFNKIPNSLELITNIININIVSCTRLIHMILPQMEAKRRGVIINISSASGAYPSPLLSVYSASKVYMDFLSRGLQLEYEDKGIIIQSVLPNFVATKLSKIRPGLISPKPNDYVNNAIKTVGIESRTYGYWTHKVVGFFQDCVIPFIMGPNYNSRIIFNELKKNRVKYYKKFGIKND